jgi:cytochrome c553
MRTARTHSRMKPVTLAIATAAGAMLLAGAAVAADLANGEAKVKQICQACHGLDGNKTLTPDYPKLGGQYPDYLAKALRDYKSGQRKNAIMQGMAAPLTPKDIEDVAAYYASQPAAVFTHPK